MWKDPIVEEIRKIRLNIETECDNDFDKIFAQAIEAQEKLVNRLVSKPASNSQMGTQKLGEKSKSKPSDEVPVSVDNVQESTIHNIDQGTKNGFQILFRQTWIPKS